MAARSSDSSRALVAVPPFHRLRQLAQGVSDVLAGRCTPAPAEPLDVDGRPSRKELPGGRRCRSSAPPTARSGPPPQREGLMPFEDAEDPRQRLVELCQDVPLLRAAPAAG